MGVSRIQSQTARQAFLRFVGFTLSIALLAGVTLVFRSAPVTKAATNPGLDSGNAIVDTTTVPGQTILKYQTTGNSTFKAPSGVTNVQVLVVGGGGGAGAGESLSGGDGGGGAGAGEYVYQSSASVTPGAATTVTVGGGGTGSTTKQPDGGTTAQNGTSGGNSLFGSLTARGGGGGGGNDQFGLSGGSGGGSGGKCTTTTTLNGGATTATSPGIGNVGGTSSGSCSNRGGSGGGGSAGAGANTSGASGASGGSGTQSTITGTNITYAAGGTGGTVGTGATGAAGAANTGSGGSGGGSSTSTTSGFGGNGGSGIVIIRFATKTTTDIAGISGLVSWYKADSGGNTNALWNDVAGLGLNLTQGTVGNQPVLTSGSLNFNPAYVFDGTDDVFSQPSSGGIGTTDSMSAFYAATSTDAAGGDRYFNEFGDDRPSITIYNGKPRLYVRDTSSIDDVYASDASLKPHIFSFISPNGGGNKIIGVDNSEQTKAVTGSYTTGAGGANTTFGKNNVSSGTSWKGPIGEAMYFNRQLTQPERQRINSYLGIKYGVTLNQGTSGTAYLDSAGATVWPADATYKNAVTGIGRDDGSTLNQKQSKNTDDFVTVGHGTIANTNQTNSNNFAADKTFMLWGNDAAATAQVTPVTGTAYMRMARTWKAVTTNTTGPIKIQIPKSEITRNTASLFVSSSATFDNTSQKVDMVSNGTNWEATATLPAGTRYFTFGSPGGTDIEFISKTATDAGGTPISAYTPGEPIEYILTVKNNGPDNAGTVTVTDTLPAGIVPTAASGGGWGNCNISGQTVSCTRSALNTGVTAPAMIIDATIAADITGAKLNSATASVANDPNTANNTKTLTLNAAPKADLSIAKQDTTSGNPTAGSDYSYNFVVTNDGPSDVASYTITDTLPSTDLSYVSASPNVCGGSSGQTITCNNTSGLDSGETKTITVTVHVDQGFGGGNITNTATVGVPAGTTDPVSGNNSSTNNTNVDVNADLQISKTHTGNFVAGESNSFTIAITNNGPSDVPAGAATVTDTLPDTLAFDAAATSGNWTCTEQAGSDTVSCTNNATIPALNTQSFILGVQAEATARGTESNTARVSSTVPDSNMSNNSSTDSTVNIVGEADLGITKTHVGTGFVAGSEAEYEFSVVNNGPSADTPSFTVTDTLPSTLTFVSATGDATCAPDGGNAQLITCTGGGIAVGETMNFTMTVMVSGSATGTINNTAAVATPAGTIDPVSGNNSDTDTVNIEPNADLSVSKVRGSDLTAGKNDETYTVTVTNNGPSSTPSFTVTDTLDANLTYVSGTGTGVTCGAVGQLVTCTGSTLTSGSSVAITLTVEVAPTATPGSTIVNRADVAPPATVNDPDLSNNNSSVSNTVNASADLSITKTHTGNFTAGSDTNEFTITVTNNGPSDAATYTVTDTLPSGMTYVDASGTDIACNNSGQIVTCTGGPVISAGESETITLTVAIDADKTGGSTLDNTTTVSSATPDPASGNNSDTDTVTIDSSADLAIVKTNATDFTAGNQEDYKIEVTNNGPSDVSSFTVTDTLPNGLTYAASYPSDPCNGSSGVNVSCTGGALASGQKATFYITVNASGSLTDGTTLNNTATVATVAPTTDPTPGNNSDTVTTTIVGKADLATTKAPTGTFVAGENATYTIQVTNNGPSDVTTNDLTVTDTLPSGMTYVSGSAGWDCSASTTAVASCTYIAGLANGNTATLSLTVNINEDKQGDVINSATASASTDDPTPGNNTGTTTTNVTAEADLVATKQAQGSITAGEDVTYTFEVTNNGPSTANNVEITDDLNGHFTYKSVSDSGWDCDEANDTVTCTKDADLVVGQTSSLDITFTVDQDAPNPLNNTAAVTFNGTDPTPANPSDSEPVTYSADLEVAIEREQKVYHSGEKVQYTYIIKNHGPSAAKDVILTDNIPNGLIVDSVSKTEPGGDSILASLNNALFPRAFAAPENPFGCSLNGGDLQCTADTLMVGTYNLYVTAHIANNFTGSLTNSLTISSSTPDPNPNNNSASNTLSDIQPGEGGLANTGQTIAIVTITSLSLLVAGVLVHRRKVNRVGSN